MMGFFPNWWLAAMSGLSVLAVAQTARAAQPESTPSYPTPIPVPDWLQQRQRFLFAYERRIGIVSVEDAAKAGIDIYCGATNAGYMGFIGGPFNWDGKDRIYHMVTGETVDTDALRAKVADAHRHKMKVIMELMRMWHPQALYIEHPEWQELHSPDAKPIGPEQVKHWPPSPAAGTRRSATSDIQQCVAFIKKTDCDGFSLDGWGCWTTCYCPACRESYRKDTGKEIPYLKPHAGGQPGIQAVASMDMEDPADRVDAAIMNTCRAVFAWHGLPPPM